MASHVVLPQLAGPLTPPENPISAAARPGLLPRLLIDSHGRTIRDLRLSITDRCNFRCVYCMDPDVRFARPDTLMSVDEMAAVVRAAMALGVRNIRLTGGEPTVHPRLTDIIRSIASLGAHDLAMTTNGSLCTRESLRTWKAAGLRRLTFSLDAVSPEGFAAMTRSPSARPRDAQSGDAAHGGEGGGGVENVLQAIRAAVGEGLGPVKVNAVVMRGRNEREVPRLVHLARELGFEMRFIEYMPLDSGHHWDRSLLVSADEILRLANEAATLMPLDRTNVHATSETYAFADQPDGPARVGLIAPVTRPFCAQCSRLRITADARVRPCLFSLHEHDLMSILRDRSLDASSRQRAMEEALLAAVWAKQKGHGITSADFVQPDRPMSAIGG